MVTYRVAQPTGSHNLQGDDYHAGRSPSRAGETADCHSWHMAGSPTATPGTAAAGAGRTPPQPANRLSLTVHRAGLDFPRGRWTEQGAPGPVLGQFLGVSPLLGLRDVFAGRDYCGGTYGRGRGLPLQALEILTSQSLQQAGSVGMEVLLKKSTGRCW